jgi:hypothetical protein
MRWVKRYFIQRRIDMLMNECRESGGEKSPFFDGLIKALNIKEKAKQ